MRPSRSVWLREPRLDAEKKKKEKKNKERKKEKRKEKNAARRDIGSDGAHPPEAKLGELFSTAIAGNDITGSCFYVVGKLEATGGARCILGTRFIGRHCILWKFCEIAPVF